MIYGLGTILGRVVSFIMLPVYTRFLSPADYGILQILDLTLDIAAIVVSAGATAGLSRFYFKAGTPEQRNQVLFTGYAIQLALNLVGGVILLGASPVIWRLALSEAGTLVMVQLAAMNFLTGTLIPVPMHMLRLDQRPVAAVSVSVTKLVVQLGLNILFVVGLEWGPMGILVSTFVTNLVVGSGMAWMLIRRTRMAFDWAVFKDFRRFAIPMQISAAGAFIIQFGDRFFLEANHGLAVVGVYGVAYQFGFLLSGMIGHPFMSAWNPRSYQLVTLPPEERNRAYNRALLVGNLVLITGAVLIATFIRPVIRVMTTPEFHAAAGLVPVILAAAVLHNWVSVVSFGITVSERTRYAAISTWITVFLILALYAVLIPPYGAMGAAVATLVAMAVRVVITHGFSQRLWRVEYDWQRHFLLYAVAASAVGGVFAFSPPGLIGLSALGIAGALVYAGLTWFVVLRPEERATYARIIRAPRRLWTYLEPERKA